MTLPAVDDAIRDYLLWFNGARKCAEQRRSFREDCVEPDAEHLYPIQLAEDFAHQCLDTLDVLARRRSQLISQLRARVVEIDDADGPAPKAQKKKKKKASNASKELSEAMDRLKIESDESWQTMADSLHDEADNMEIALREKVASALPPTAIDRLEPRALEKIITEYVFQRYGTQTATVAELRTRLDDDIDKVLLAKCVAWINKKGKPRPFADVLKAIDKMGDMDSNARSAIARRAFLLSLMTYGRVDDFNRIANGAPLPATAMYQIIEGTIGLLYPAWLSVSRGEEPISKGVHASINMNDMLSNSDIYLDESVTTAMLVNLMKLLVNDQFPFQRAFERDYIFQLLKNPVNLSPKRTLHLKKMLHMDREHLYIATRLGEYLNRLQRLGA